MHHTRLRNSALAATVALSVGACAVPHNNVLVFGTDTNYGIGISAAPDPAAPASITIGYKRKEAVWMPLIVNRQACTDTVDNDGTTSKTCTNATAVDADDSSDPKVDTSAKYVGKAGGVDKSRGGSSYEEDTYSVFASFGGSAKASGDGGAVAVAQFFATGIAAQRLGANPGATRLVSAATGNAATVRDAEERAEAAEGKVKDFRELTGFTDAQLATTIKENQIRREQVDVTLAIVFGQDGKLSPQESTKWGTVVDGLPAATAGAVGFADEAAAKAAMKTFSKEAELKEFLSNADTGGKLMTEIRKGYLN